MLGADMSEIEKEIRELREGLNKVNIKITSLENKDELTTYKFNQIIDTLKEMDCKIDKLNQVPSKRWELIVSAAISCLTTSLLGYFILKK